MGKTIEEIEEGFFDVEKFLKKRRRKAPKRKPPSLRAQLQQSLHDHGHPWSIFAPIASRIVRKAKFHHFRRSKVGIHDEVESIVSEAVEWLPMIYENYDPERSVSLFNNAMMVIDIRLTAATISAVRAAAREGRLISKSPTPLDIVDRKVRREFNLQELRMDVTDALKKIGVRGTNERSQFFEWVCLNIMAGATLADIARRSGPNRRPSRSTGKLIIDQMISRSNIQTLLSVYAAENPDADEVDYRPV